MPDFPIIDAHVHLYDPRWLRYSWTDGSPVLARARRMAEFDAARGALEVEAIVWVEVAADPGLHLAEAAWVQALADADPRIAGLVAQLPVENGAGVEEDLDRLMVHAKLRGVRRLIQTEADPGFCLEPGFVEGVRRAAARGLSFDICVKHWQLTHAVELVRRLPEATFVLDHIGKPGIRHGLHEPWAAELARLARQPNVVCKLSGVVTEADHGAWQDEELVFYIDHALQCFGPERTMFGSDWPVGELTHDYGRWIDIVDRATRTWDESARHALWRETARRVYRL